MGKLELAAGKPRETWLELYLSAKPAIPLLLPPDLSPFVLPCCLRNTVRTAHRSRDKQDTLEPHGEHEPIAVSTKARGGEGKRELETFSSPASYRYRQRILSRREDISRRGDISSCLVPLPPVVTALFIQFIRLPQSTRFSYSISVRLHGSDRESDRGRCGLCRECSRAAPLKTHREKLVVRTANQTYRCHRDVVV